MVTHAEKNFFTGRIESVNFMGHFYEYVIRSGEDAVWTYKQFKEHQIKERYKIGDPVSYWFDPQDCFVWKKPQDLQKELSL
jgi:ABC-type Fe3+/spermidine/putrescine transport system ATPase subunit